MPEPWLHCIRGDAPLIVAFPHTGTQIPEPIERRLLSPWLARKDADWWVHRLYDFVTDLGATTVRTDISRTVIDVNRDPTGASLYPGQATTGLCPLVTFDGEALYQPGEEPDSSEIAGRRDTYFRPYHETLEAEIARLKKSHGEVMLYDAHSIRSLIPRLFDGELPHLNLGTDNGRTCSPALEAVAADACSRSGFTSVLNGRFRGGWTTRRYGKPETGVHAIQMELACRTYMDEPLQATPANWPPDFDPQRAQKSRQALSRLLDGCLSFFNARKQERS